MRSLVLCAPLDGGYEALVVDRDTDMDGIGVVDSSLVAYVRENLEHHNVIILVLVVFIGYHYPRGITL